jgi:transglutaminase-like putative cysteine protease
VKTPGKITVAGYQFIAWCGLISLALTLGYLGKVVHPWLIALSALGAVWAMRPSRRGRRGPSTTFFSILAVLIVARALGAFAADRDALYLIGDCLTALLPVCLTRRRRPLGYWVSVLTCFLLALTGVVAESELAEYALFLLFLAFLIVNLNAANLFFLSGATLSSIQTLPRRYVSQFLRAAVMGFLMGAAIFFLFPRDYIWNHPLGSRNREKTSGYGGSVTLDGSAQIGLSSALAAQIEAKNVDWLQRTAGTFYLRGNTVDEFDGSHWTSTDRGRRPFKDARDVTYTNYAHRVMHPVTIYREPSSNPAIVYPGALRGAYFPTFIGRILVDKSGSLYRASPQTIRYSYETIFSDPGAAPGWNAVPGKKIKAQLLAQRDLRPYLQVPESIRAAPYFQAWLKAVPVNTNERPIGESLEALRLYFKKEFTPTLLREASATSPLEGFLQDKKGHCEYFATASAMYLRAQGIPTRLVLGYHGGVFNQISRVVEFRDSDAHAWVEVYYPGGGWHAFDPTPFIPAPFAPLEWARLALNAASFWFNRYVVEYNSQTQVALFRSLLRPGPGKTEPWKWPGVGKRRFLAALGLGIGLGFVVWVFRFRQRSNSSTVPDYYRAFERIMRRRGWARKHNETYAAFHDRLKRAGVDAGLIDKIHVSLEKDLYSAHPVDASSRRELRLILRHFNAPLHSVVR